MTDNPTQATPDQSPSPGFISTLGPVERALEAVEPTAAAGTVLFQADNDEMNVLGIGDDVVTVTVPAKLASGSLAFGYDDLMGVVRGVAAERRDQANDERLVIVRAGDGSQPVLEVDGLEMYGQRASARVRAYVPADFETVATLERAAFRAAVPEHLAHEPDPAWWSNHLVVAVSDGRVVLGARDRLATIVSVIATATDDRGPFDGEVTLDAGFVTRVARSWRSERVELGYHRGPGERVWIGMRCGEVTLHTVPMWDDHIASEHISLAIDAQPAITVGVERSDLLAAAERCIDQLATTMVAHPQVMLRIDGGRLTVVPTVAGHVWSVAQEEGTPSMLWSTRPWVAKPCTCEAEPWSMRSTVSVRTASNCRSTSPDSLWCSPTRSSRTSAWRCSSES
jgi:hypothetical protein